VRLDSLLQRFFPAVIGVLVAISAYFQASGINHVLSTVVARDAPRPPPPPSGGPPPPDDHFKYHARSANAIIERNPFDSATGSLIPPPQAADTPPSTDPYDDPPCDMAQVVLIAYSDDPDWSFVSIAPARGERETHRRGDDFQGFRVENIAADRVWLSRGGARCQSIIHDPTHRPPPVAGMMPGPYGGPYGPGGPYPPGMQPYPQQPMPQTAPPRRRDQIPPELAAKIHKVSDTQFNIDRSALDQMINNQELLQKVRIQPIREGDQVTSLRLVGVQPGSLLASLGLQNGDHLKTINGYDMTNPQAALEAYSRLTTADKFNLSVVRDGRPMNVEYNVK
jgi:general secretion pathway protein C